MILRRKSMEVHNIIMLVVHLYHFCLSKHFPISLGATAPSLSVSTFWGYFFSTFLVLIPSILSASPHSIAMSTDNFPKKKSRTTQCSLQACLLTFHALHTKNKTPNQTKTQHTDPYKVTVNFIFH